MTTKTDTLAGALVKALAEIEGAAKDKVNPHFKSKYADLASVIAAIKPVLAKHGLAFTQSTEPSEGGVIVETLLWHEAENLAPRSLGKLFVPANKNDAQGFGSALTYARRYGLMTAFGVPAEDDDGNAAAKSYTPANNGSTARPTTGETPPNKRVKLEGTYTCPTQLMTAAREFVRTLESADDLEEFEIWQASADVVDFLDQLKRDMPEWWQGGPTMPDEFVPLEIRIAQKRRDLEQIDELRNRERTVLDAG